MPVIGLNYHDTRKRYYKEWEKYLYSKGLSYNKMLKVICKKNIFKKPPEE